MSYPAFGVIIVLAPGCGVCQNRVPIRARLEPSRASDEVGRIAPKFAVCATGLERVRSGAVCTTVLMCARCEAVGMISHTQQVDAKECGRCDVHVLFAM